VRLAVLVACLVACGDNVPGDVTVVATTWTDALGSFASVGVTIESGSPPTADTKGFQIGVTDDPAMPAEGYRIDLVAGASRTWLVHAHDVLGAQYGVAAALEHLGYRFRHPFDPYIPIDRRPVDEPLGVVHRPDVRVRGFQLHTLHPIESYYAFWGGRTDDAHRIIDWLVANRGNFLQWVALDDIRDPARHADWQSQTRELIDYAHAHGVRVGINLQLFSQSSLQNALTLVDSSTAPVPDQIAANLPLLTDGLPWDVYSISFGEFFDADPQAFLDALNEATRQLHALAPGAEVHAVVHVGGTQLVTYMGQTLLYYFLVKFADSSIIPDIHTVMYYDLFEDAGGAYQMQDFSAHRQYLLDRMCAGQPAAYFPETAYWIAFDDSVPLMLPIYVRTRQLDLAQLRAAGCGPLDEHLIFSSGWEWGYWLHDTATLRASYELPTAPGDAIAEQLAPELGAAAPVISDLADVQHDALIGQRLAAYMASRDALIDAGRTIGVVSQPDRVTFDDLVADTPDARSAFATNVLAPLAEHASALDALDARLEALDLPDERWASELRDGLAVDRERAHFIHDAYAAILAHLAGDELGAAKARDLANSALLRATEFVHHRHGDLHDPDRTIIGRDANSTVYAFGYLYMADQLCYWHRELDQVDSILQNTSITAPSCVF
jgi:hypothetical protein